MLLFGHPYIPSQKFYHIEEIDDVVHTPSNSVIYLEWNEKNLDIVEYLQSNHITFALRVTDIKGIIFASLVGASFIFVPKELAKTAHNIAQNYLFDAKILVCIDGEEEIEAYALLGIDGVAFGSSIVKITTP